MNSVRVNVATASSVAVVAALVSPAVAGGFQIPETGTRRTAMAAVVGRPDDPSAVFHNPAGLTLLDGVHVYVHAGVAKISTEFNLAPWDLRDDGTYGSDEFLGQTAGPDGYYDPVKPSLAVGVIPMIVGTAQLTRKLYGAASFYVGNATGAAFDDDDATQYHLIQGYVVAPQANLSLAYKINDKVAVAGSIGVVHLRVKGRRYFYPVYNGLDLRTLGLGDKPLLRLEGTAWAPAWNLGVLVRPMPKLTIGAAAIGKVETAYKGAISLESSDDPDMSMYGSQETTQYLPLTLQAGANYDVTPNLEVGLEGRYWYYTPYKQQKTDIDGFIIPELVTEKNYKNSKQIAGGLRVHDLRAAPGWEFMLGAHFDKTPAPAETLTLDQPSFDHPGVHSGVRYTRGSSRFGLTYTRYWYLVPDVDDSITFPPTNFTGSGVSNIISLSYEGSFDVAPLVGR
ncbi:MAG: outer membrane protein transport protein [Kofleriaceae bacterium]